MSNATRNDAIETISGRTSGANGACEKPITEIFGEDVFHLATMKNYLSKHVYQKLQQTVEQGAPLDPAIADDVANAMKLWAISKGASHYTHWFQPLTGSTAEKHDAFIEPDGAGGVVLNFSGKNLIVGESDASSFPSGGLRSTFEARGYTAWDPTSPAFLKKGPTGATLCIPTAFCSYTGEALDKKTPLLRSIQALGRAINRLLACFGEGPEQVEITLGAEQEYFLIDKAFYLARPDLIQTGRTLFGAPPPKHQQLEDHYYGSIKPRVLAFMTEVDQELWRLGIPAKTRHNEVAPAQFEIASVFEELNLASDHNMMTMEVLRQVADRHDFVCLLHEKPFAGVNGSGKHNNWSPGTKKRNLLNPGNDPHQNALFLTTLCAVIMGVDRHGELLRAATAGPGNRLRLGANEAPPAIISVYLGDQLSAIIDELESGTPSSTRKRGTMKIGVDALPALPLDTTDRNRTSPFAYTGNKFEFRAPGAGQTCAGPNVVLNVITAEALDDIVDELEKAPKEKLHEALQAILRKVIRRHKRIIFNGDNYSAEWIAEAERRGLPHLRNVEEALAAFISEKSIRMFEKYGVFSAAELHSRYEVYLEEYRKRVRIEAELSLTIARTLIFPAVSRQLGELSRTISAMRDAGIGAGLPEQRAVAEEVGRYLEAMVAAEYELEAANRAGHPADQIQAMDRLRQAVDTLEKLVADEWWPLPKYREMLFIY